MKIKKANATIPEVDMTPMIDIVFLLLSFFMMVLNFENANADERVKLPRNELAKPSEKKRDKDLILNFGFNRDREGKAVAGPFVFYSGEEVPVKTMKKYLEVEKRTYKDMGVKLSDITVVIRADAEVPTGQVQDLIKVCQEIEFEKFALMAMHNAP